jgi:hypothetical protein
MTSKSIPLYIVRDPAEKTPPAARAHPRCSAEPDRALIGLRPDRRMITQQQLDGYLDKSIGKICPNGFASNADNHCAHFVGHVLGYRFGVTCQIMSHGQLPGVSIRVQEIFPKCPAVGAWSLRPASLSSCLVFITRVANVNLAGKVMSNVPRKHIGIFFGGMIWHYSNSQHKVVKQTPAQFAQHYPAPDNGMFYGSLP